MKREPPFMLSCFLYIVYMSTIGIFFLIAISNNIPTRVLPIQQDGLQDIDPVEQYFLISSQSQDLNNIDPIEQYFAKSAKSDVLEGGDPIEQYFENSVCSKCSDNIDPIEQYFLNSVQSIDIDIPDTDKMISSNKVKSNITNKVPEQFQNRNSTKPEVTTIPANDENAGRKYNLPKENDDRREKGITTSKIKKAYSLYEQYSSKQIENMKELDRKLSIIKNFLSDLRSKNSTQERPEKPDKPTSTARSSLKLKFTSSVVDIPEPACSRKQLIYTCSQEESCGGLGDRQRGIVSLFLLAIFTNRTFGISFTKSCPLTNFFLPNIYDWTKCLPLKRSANDLEKKYEKFLKGPENFADFKTGIWEQDIIVLNNHAYLGNKLKSHPDAKFIVPWIFPQMLRHLTHSVFHFFFKLRDEIKTQLYDYINKITENHTKVLVGVHVREEFINKGDEKYIIAFIESYANSSKYSIYLATDTADLRQYASNVFPNLYTLNVTGTALHTDEKSASCETLLIAIFEQQILAHSDILVKSPSVFSHMAFGIRGPKGITYDFKPANDKFPARFERKDFT